MRPKSGIAKVVSSHRTRKMGKASDAKSGLAVLYMRGRRIRRALHRSTALRRLSGVTLRRTTAFLEAVRHPEAAFE